MAQRSNESGLRRAWYCNVAAGFAQGITRVAISYPFDYVRVRMQAFSGETAMSAFKHALDRPGKGSGIRGLYAGASVSFVNVGLDRAVQFGVFEQLLKKHKLTPWQGAACTSAVSLLYNLPFQNIITQVIVNNKDSRSAITHLLRSYVRNGKFTLQNTHRGWSAELCRAYISPFVYLGVYASLRDATQNGDLRISLTQAAAFGVVSNLTCWAVTYPLDTVRVMIQSRKEQVFHARKNELQEMFHLLKTTRTRTLYRGLPIVLARTVPSASIGMVVYEYVRGLL